MKTQKFLLPALLMFGSFLASCSKENIESDARKLAAKNALASTNGEMGTLAAIDTNSVKTSLSAAPWVYYELLGSYHRGVNGVGKLLYKHERTTNNALNVRNDITTYNAAKNTFIETVPGAFGSTITIEGYFFFTYKSNVTKSEVILTTVITAPSEYRGTYSSELVRLPDNINYVWYSEASDRLGIMYHQNTIPVSSTGTVKSRLITKKWQYENYFRDYALVDCDLLYRANRRGDVPLPIDLSQIQVVYSADDTFTETILSGGSGGQDIVQSGRWWLTNNETLLHTQLNGGVENVAEIRLLNANRLQWATLPGGVSSRAATNPITYADMVIQGTTIP